MYYRLVSFRCMVFEARRESNYRGISCYTTQLKRNSLPVVWSYWWLNFFLLNDLIPIILETAKFLDFLVNMKVICIPNFCQRYMYGKKTKECVTSYTGMVWYLGRQSPMLADGKFFPTRTGKERDKSTLTAPSTLLCFQKSPFNLLISRVENVEQSPTSTQSPHWNNH